MTSTASVVGIEEVGDLVVEMQQLAAELIQVLRLDVFGIDHPRFHDPPPDRLGRDGTLLLCRAVVNLCACPMADPRSARCAEDLLRGYSPNSIASMSSSE